ncbi:MAG TPA: hypothetical protein VFG05_08770 [Methylocella sp.]|nr:hypothetical protein [Methylocella sp.]
MAGQEEKRPLEESIDAVTGWLTVLKRIRERYGLLGALLIVGLFAAGTVWWHWKDIAERPGVAWIINYFSQGPVNPAPAGRLTLAIAQLGHDKDREHEILLRDELRQLEGVETIAIGRPIDAEEQSKSNAEKEVRELLQQSGADALIWGSVVNLGGRSAMRLYWTPSRHVPGAASTGKYLPQTETLELPAEFWNDLKQILGLLAQSRLAELTFGQQGHYVADRLAPLIGQVRQLAASKRGDWTAETLAGVQSSLAVALAIYGEQSGKSAPLDEAAALFRNVLDARPRERVPLQWAATQNNLGNALQAADGALVEFRKAKAYFYIQKAERQRSKILAEKSKL